MSAALLWCRSVWRQRWPALLLAAIVLALTGTVSLGAAMQARRSESAFTRLRAATDAADLQVTDVIDPSLGDDPGGTLMRLADGLRATGAAIEDHYFVRPLGAGLIPNLDLFAIVEHQVGREPIDVPIAVRGRLPDAAAADEIGVSEQLADDLGVGPGDHLTLESATPAWLEQSFSGNSQSAPDGPLLDVVVTGVLLAPLDFSAPRGVIHLTPAFAERYGTVIWNWPSAQLDLTDEAQNAVAMTTGNPATGDPRLDAGVVLGGSPWGDQRQVDDGLRVAATGLWLVSFIGAISGMGTFVLLARRLLRAATADLDTLTSLGLTRSVRARYGVALGAPSVVLGLGACAVGGILASPLARIGLADRVEPDRSPFVDLPVLIVVVGTLGVLAALGLLSAVPSRIPRHAIGRPASRPPVRHPLPATLGARRALTRIGQRASNVGTLVATTALVTAGTGALVFGASLHELPRHSGLWGSAADVVLDFGERSEGEANDPYEQTLTTLAADPRVERITGTTTFFPTIGRASVPSLVLDGRRGPAILTILAGRAPDAPDEVAMGRATMRRLGVGLGDEVPITFAGTTASFRIVGRASFPIGDLAFDDGAAVTPTGRGRLPTTDHTSSAISQVRLTWRHGVDKVAATATLAGAGLPVFAARQPPTVTNLGQLGSLPAVLTGFFGLLALALVGYTLSISSRERRRQAGILSALGLRRGQLAGVTRWQAATIGTVAVAAGLPLGLVLGRAVWSFVASRTGVLVAHEFPYRGLGVFIAIGLGGSIVIATAINLADRRRPPFESLRTG